MEFTSKEFDFAFAVWGNSTLGLLSYWWHSSRQQAGRGDMTIRAIDTLPVLDFRALSDEQLAVAEGIFDEFRELELQPAYLADADANRALLDRRVVCDLLGFGPRSLPRRPPAGGQVVRRAVGSRRQGPPGGGAVRGVTGRPARPAAREPTVAGAKNTGPDG